MTDQEKEPSCYHYIVAPHCDDEIIGCSEILNNELNSVIIMYSSSADQARREEAIKLREHYHNLKAQLFQKSIAPTMLSNPNITFHFPNPVTEIHPLHRELGAVGEAMAREGKDVIFYTTIMNVPYIHEIDSPENKEYMLNKIYPSQKSLWEYEKKFILFEGRCKWMF